MQWRKEWLYVNLLRKLWWAKTGLTVTHHSDVLPEIVDFFFVDTTPFQLKYWTHPKDDHYDWRGVTPREKYLANLLKVHILNGLTDDKMSYDDVPKQSYFNHLSLFDRIWMRPSRNQLQHGRLRWAIIPWGVSVIMVILRSFCSCFFQSSRLLIRMKHNISFRRSSIEKESLDNL